MERKLAAIFSADVQGYSRLMGDDEEATIRTLTTYREVMTRLIQQHRGRVVDSPGDNLLAEFASVVEAVQCAVAVQRELTSRNVELPAHRQMVFRIGINLGDVIVEGKRLYGDGVNIAARLEGLAEGGGICLSGTAYDQVETKLALGYTDLGEQTVKNIAKPVRAYQVHMEPETDNTVARAPRAGLRQGWWAATAAVLVVVLGVTGALLWHMARRGSVPPPEGASTATMAPTRPDKQSIAILPFTNFSSDVEQEYFADGMTDDLITDLSKVSGLFVVARNSAFSYKGRTVKVQEVAEELGVQYVLEGSVRRAGGTVRINAQLIDATTGGHVWAETFDRPYRDIFALQDEVIAKIVAALQVHLTDAEQARLARKPTTNMEAYDSYLRAEAGLHSHDPSRIAEALGLYEKAVALDPTFAEAYAAEAHAAFLVWRNNWMHVMPENVALERFQQSLARALALDPDLPRAQRLQEHRQRMESRHQGMEGRRQRDR